MLVLVLGTVTFGCAHQTSVRPNHIREVSNSVPEFVPAEHSDVSDTSDAAAAEESSAPLWTEGDTSKPVDPDYITYRSLRRDDFRGEEPPLELVAHGLSLGAAICAVLRTNPKPRVRTESITNIGDYHQFEATISGLHFEAVIDRNCSWWNRIATKHTMEYVLQHEQAHFALFELATRELNTMAPRLERTIRVRSGNADVAIAEVSRLIDIQFDQVMERYRQRSAQLDAETSRSYQPAVQHRWWRQIEAELAASGHR